MILCKVFHRSTELEERRFCSINPAPDKGLSLIVRSIQNPANVVESAMIFQRRNSSCGTVGKFSDEGGGFRTCTESLGFESSDERVIGDQEGDQGEKQQRVKSKESVGEEGRAIRTKLKRKETKVFPPPLPGLERSARTRSFLKAERKDGRLVLKEVRIERPQIFRTSREAGRLRLQLVRPLKAMEEDEEEEERVGRWQYGELQRCNEKGTLFSGWSPRCVTIK